MSKETKSKFDGFQEGTLLDEILISRDNNCTFSSTVSSFRFAIRLTISILTPGKFTKNGVENWLICDKDFLEESKPGALVCKTANFVNQLCNFWLITCVCSRC